MSHRLQQLHRRKIQHTQSAHEPVHTPSQQTQNSYSATVPNGKITKTAKQVQGARPIFPPTNIVKPFQRNDFRKGQLVFPPPQSLYSSKDTEVDPRFIRSSCAVLNSQVQKTALPLAVWITPFASEQVNTAEVAAPLRCNRCKGYVNPYFQFDGTRRSVACNLCGLRFGVPETIDKNNLSSTQIATQSIVDFRVSDKLYFKKRTDIIKTIVLVELTMPMMELAVFSSVCEGVKSVIDSHQFDSAVRIGIAFYSDQGVGFIRLPQGEKQPNVFMVPQGKGGPGCFPLSQSEFFADPSTQRERLVSVLDFLQKYSQFVWKQSRFTHSAGYTFALRCAREAYEQQTGRILLFSLLDPRSGLCSIRPRTQQEAKNPLKPIHLQAHEFAKQLLRARIGVEHFIFSKDTLVSHQLSTTHFLSSSTGGKIHYYSHFVAQTNGNHLYYSIFHTLTKSCYYDVEFTCRTSNGLNVVRYGAPDGPRESRDVSLSVVDNCSSFTIQFEQQQKLQENLGAFVQFAAMYTTASGQRRIRVINYKFQVNNRPGASFQSMDYLTFSSCLLRNYSIKLIRGGDPAKCREDCINYIGAVVGQARNRLPTANATIRDLTIPSGMVWSFSYLSSVLNSKLFLGWFKMSPDARIVDYLRIQQLNPYFFTSRFYPRLYPLTLDIYEVEEGSPMPGDFIEEEEGVQVNEQNKIAILPANLPLTKASAKENGVYLLDNGEQLVILVQAQADQDLLLELFGTTDLNEIEASGLPELQTSHNIRVNNIVNELRRRSTLHGGMYQPLSVKTALKKGPYGEYFFSILKEDSYDCPFNNFIDAIQRAIVTPK